MLIVTVALIGALTKAYGLVLVQAGGRVVTPVKTRGFTHFALAVKSIDRSAA